MGKNEARGFVAGGACFGKARGDRVRKTRECDEGESDRIELTPDLVGAVTSLCVIQRKKRMARQRRSSLNVLTFSHVPPPPARAIDRTRLRFLFQKELQTSDVNSLRRMIVPKVIRARKASDQDSYTDSAVDGYVLMNSSDSETSYVYETTFSNDSLFDFWSGPMTYSSKVEPIGSFESIENLSMEELLLSF
ncbi:RHOMBOID-like 2 [Actinidia rufa]|uniref:RHOMBOID-like 2 n=1 Tax=Actinidia rufa TaxID=165716 RepID=A0A7J0E9Z0_9ERIC|nr:RHOMBOID-like 2 [Actinidia rufa]